MFITGIYQNNAFRKRLALDLQAMLREKSPLDWLQGRISY
jgi:hypothetical protein